MKRLLLISGFAALLAAVLTGCGAAGSGAASSSPKTQPAPAATVTISYPIRTGMGSREHAARACPAAADCTYISVGATAAGAPIWMPLVHQHLTCSPGGGTYRDPTAACQALFDLRHRVKIRRQVCMCPMIIAHGASLARGVVDGDRLMLDLSPCSLCGLGEAASADAAVLMPGAFSS